MTGLPQKRLGVEIHPKNSLSIWEISNSCEVKAFRHSEKTGERFCRMSRYHLSSLLSRSKCRNNLSLIELSSKTKTPSCCLRYTCSADSPELVFANKVWTLGDKNESIIMTYLITTASDLSNSNLKQICGELIFQTSNQIKETFVKFHILFWKKNHLFGRAYCKLTIEVFLCVWHFCVFNWENFDCFFRHCRYYRATNVIWASCTIVPWNTAIHFIVRK